MVVCARCGFQNPRGARFCSNCGAALAQGGLAAPVRKHVVILFADIVGSTSLGESVDPEALRVGLSRYFDVVSHVVWDRGGTVEKFIGDAVMAVFGVPVTREDDALRAVDAARTIHARVAELSTRMRARLGRGLQVRIGVNQGEVFVTHQPDGQFSVTGDAVNVAARLQAAADPGETYVGDTVADLVGTKVPLELVGPMLHKGKTTPQQVYRVADGSGATRAVHRTPFAGRAEELAELDKIATRTTDRGQGWYLTLVGEPGIGKHRLIAHFLAGRDGMRVLRGSSQPLADTTFGPVARLLRRLGDDWQEQISEMFPESVARAVLRRLASATGRSDETTSTDDIAWALRRVFKALAAAGPIAVVWEDLQWCSDAQLDLIERVVAGLRTHPVLTICLTRPELFERRPMWGGGRQSRVEDLDPMRRADLRAMAADRREQVEKVAAAQGSRADILLDSLITRSDGNPQVFEVLLQSLTEGTQRPVSVHTLFEATLDRLDPIERAFCEGASVLGREFFVEAVLPVLGEKIAGDADARDVADRLRQLNILEPADVERAGLTTYRFVQSMLMETAYRTMPRQVRAERHERAADWIAEHDDLVAGSQRQAVASHLRQAYDELHRLGADTAALDAVRGRAAVAGFAAAEELDLRGDAGARPAYLALFELFGAGDARLHDVAHRAFFRSDQHEPSQVDQVVHLADQKLGDTPAWRPQRDAMQLVARMQSGQLTPAAGITAAQEISTAAIFDAPDTLSVRIDVGWALALAYGIAGMMTQGLGELGTLQSLVDEADDRPMRGVMTFARVEFGLFGPRRVPVVLADVNEGLRTHAARRDRVLQLLPMRAWLRAMAGDRDGAYADWARVGELTGDEVTLAHAADRWAMALYTLGEPRQAATLLDAGLDLVTPMARLENRMWIVRLLLRSGDLAAARAAFDGDIAAPTAEEDGYSPGLRDGVVAQLLAASGQGDLARVRLQTARDATAEISMPVTTAELATDSAVVGRLLGDEELAQRCMRQARETYEAKGAIAMAANVERWLANATQLRPIQAG